MMEPQANLQEIWPADKNNGPGEIKPLPHREKGGGESQPKIANAWSTA